MVYLIGASSLSRAFKNAPYSLKSSIQKRFFSVSGLSFIPRSEKLKNIGYIQRQSNFKNRKNLVCWHDVINKSITKRISNNYRVKLVKILKQHTKNFIAIVYCQRFGTPNIYEDMKMPSKNKKTVPSQLRNTLITAAHATPYCIWNEYDRLCSKRMLVSSTMHRNSRNNNQSNRWN